MDKFWVVLRDPDQRDTYKQNIVTRKHLAEEDARDEAERLASQEGKKFFVMEALLLWVQYLRWSGTTLR